MASTGLEEARDDVFTVSCSSKVESTPAYLRGFHDAEKRREIVNIVDQLPFTTLVWQYTIAMSPFALLWVGGLWLISRGKRRANLGSAGVHTARKGNGMPGFTTPPEVGSKWNEGFPQKGDERGNFREELKNVFQNAMTPLTPRNFLVNVKGTRFKDVIGMPEAVVQVQQYVDFLQHPEKFTRLGARLPKGCLLSGPPGTGKTLLAKAVAGEADVLFFTCNGADFVELYAGSGPKRVRELFEAAKSKAPSVIFIDELDAVGSRSGQAVGSSISAEENRTINQLLAELDGLSSSGSIVVFAATNFKENIDKALLREGRFDRKVELSLPDQNGREALFAHYLKKIKLEEGNATTTPTEVSTLLSSSTEVKEVKDMRYDLVIAAQLASLTPGASPATIATIVNEAALQAAVLGLSAVPSSCLLPAVDDVLWGKKQFSRTSRIPDSALLRTAWYESGHALVAWLLAPLQSKVLKVSIIPRHLHASPSRGGERGGMLTGYTQQVGREALDMKTELSLFSDVCVMLGGRQGELMLMQKQEQRKESVYVGTRKSSVLRSAPYDPLQALSTGAQDDLQRATNVALENFLSFGMAPPAPPVVVAGARSSGGMDLGKTRLPTHLGMLSYEPQRLREGRIYQKHSSATQALAEEEAKRYIDAASRFVEALVQKHADVLENLAAALLEKKELHREDLEYLLRDVKKGLSLSLLDDLEGPQEESTPVEMEQGTSGSASICSTEPLSNHEREWNAVKAQTRRALAVFIQASEEATLQRALGRSTLLPSAE